MKISSSSISPLNGKTFVLELSRDIRFKAKQDLINYLREQNAQISYILTASTDYVLVSNDIDTYKTRRAKQLGIPLVNIEYIYECRNLPTGKEAVDVKRFIVTSAEDKENFSKSGTIPVSGVGSSSTSTTKSVKSDLSKIKIWNSDDVELPKFDELTHAETGKWAIFKETNENSDVYFALELQIIPEEFNNPTKNDYRFRFRYEKQTITSSKGKLSLIQYAFSQDISELHQLFASYYSRIATMPRITRIRDLLPDKLGSKLLLRSLFLHRLDTQSLDDNVCQLIESLWIESIGDLNQILSVRPESITLKTIIEAEAALLEIKSDSKSASEAETRFYSLIPHQQLFIVDLLNDRRALIDKTDLCQMLRDMLTVNELTNWNIKASIEAKYRALKCHIETVGNETQEYATISEMISASTNSNEKVFIHQIYSVAKQTDVLNFRSTLFDQKQLFHGSKYKNFLGILSRGLLMPKMVVNDLGITRTDIGCLGFGIYFSDSVSTSLKYTTPSTTRPGRRLLCISQVALGDSAKFYSYAPNLTQPPDDFHSTHGVKKNNENNSKFVDDEYAVYNLDQQRLLYIVELSWIPYDEKNQSLKLLPIIRDQLTNRSIIPTKEVDIPATIEDEVIQVAEQDYGLICPSSGELVPLKAFHIRAQLVDVTAEVVLYQVYHNTSSVPIEAKYVFPLEENCSVCGFEAHINNKIIKGVVKEKEQAKREYREAIEKGHGAYLMHQEQPEVFSVSVGNLPANCEVIIKITYVAELPIENNDIIFRLPAKVASWQSKQALEMKDQTLLPSINLQQENSSLKSVEFSLKTSIRMPYEIIKLFSPTHRLRRKITDCIAMIELIDNILLEKDFILSITLKAINLPRMLNETYDVSNENSQACMLTFYPKFEMPNNSNELVEIVFLIDVSNSMDGNSIQQAKQLAHLFLTNIKQDGNIYFNIATFGSDNDECFPISSANTKENIDKAKHFILHSLDHRGNTDLFSILRQYSLLPSSSKLGRQFLLLSDGHINDLKSILTLLENQASMRHDRLFTCAIGDTSNKHYLKQLANQANGGGLTTVFDSNYRSRWKTKVLQILEHIHQPCVTNISIDWHGTMNHQEEIFTNQAPKIIRSLFNGMRLTVYRFIENCHKATLTARMNNQEFVTNVFSNKITETKGRILHCLTARAITQDYENGLLDNDESENELIKKQCKQDLIELSMKYSVVSSLTSFVAIEERDGQALQPGVRLLDVMLEHDLDLLPYIGWDGDRSQIDLIKEKLINAKRSFDSASISNKIQLTNDYENLCQNISYRSGGDAKYQLMLTIIDSYRMILNEKEKARELEEKMKDDLISEINNATADERKILEERLIEINTRFEIEEVEDADEESPDAEIFEPCYAYMDAEMASFEEVCSIQQIVPRKLSNKLVSFNSESSEDEWKAVLTERRDVIKGPELVDVEDDDDALDFDLFDYDEGEKLQSLGENLQVRAALPKTEAEAWSSSDEEGDDMGFGLFDDDIPASFSSTSFKKKIESAPRPKEYCAEAAEPTDDILLLDSNENKLSATISSKESIMESLKQRLSIRRAFLKDEKEVSSSSVSTSDTSAIQINASTPEIKQVPLPSSKPSPQFFPQQQQQQEQQAMSQPSYFPSSPSYLFDCMADSSCLDLNAITPALEQTNRSSSIFAQPPQPFLVPVTIDTPTWSSGFGSVLSSTTAPPPSFLSSTPFGSSVANNNTTASPRSTEFGGWTSSTNARPIPPPPPPPGALFSFTPLGSNLTNNNNNTAFMSTGFGGSTTFSSAAPPPPALTPANSALFGSSSASNSNVFGMQVGPPMSVNQQMYTPFSFQHPPPPPPPPPPMAAGFSFGGQSFTPQQQSFSFGSSSSTTTSANVAPPTTADQLTFAAPAAPPPPPMLPSNMSVNLNRTLTQLRPSSSKAASSPERTNNVSSSYSMKSAFAPTADRQESAKSTVTVVQEKSGNALFGISKATTKADKLKAKQFISKKVPVSTIDEVQARQSSLNFCMTQPNEQLSEIVPTLVNQSLPEDQNTLSGTIGKALHNVWASVSARGSAASTTSFGDRGSTRMESYSGRASDMRKQDAAAVRDSDNSDRKDVPSYKSSRGGRGGGFSLANKQRRKREEAPQIEQDIASAKAQTPVCDSSIQLQRFCDTRSDEAIPQQSEASMSKLWSDNDDDDDDYFYFSKADSKKKKIKSKESIRSVKLFQQDLLLLDVVPLGLGIEDINGHMCTIITRNRTIPTKTQFYSVFTNAYAYQSTATIRVFQGEHKLTKYNILMGEFILTDLTSNFASQVLEISIRMDLDANGILKVEAEESRSGAKAKITIDPSKHTMSANDIEQHVRYVASNRDFQAVCVADRQTNDPLYMLKGETENTKINFTGAVEISEDFPTFEKLKNLQLTSTTINELKRIQLADGSFNLDQDFVNMLSTDIKDIDTLKTYFYKQGFNSFALNIQKEIIRLIATGILLMELLLQVPTSELNTYLVPFDHKQIRSIFHRHLPKLLLENVDKAIDFYEQKRLRYGIYCEQLELDYSSWEKFIQYSIFHLD